MISLIVWAVPLTSKTTGAGVDGVDVVEGFVVVEDVAVVEDVDVVDDAVVVEDVGSFLEQPDTIIKITMNTSNSVNNFFNFSSFLLITDKVGRYFS
jgi:hypothetical protein